MTPSLHVHLDASLTRRWTAGFFHELAQATLEHLEIGGHVSLAITLVASKEMQRINRDYRGIDSPTDVIAFAFDETTPLPTVDDVRHLGEIYLAQSVIRTQAKRFGHSTKAEMRYIFVHGLLHLLGYDHQTPKTERTMTALSKIIIAKLTSHA